MSAICKSNYFQIFASFLTLCLILTAFSLFPWVAAFRRSRIIGVLTWIISRYVFFRCSCEIYVLLQWWRSASRHSPRMTATSLFVARFSIICRLRLKQKSWRQSGYSITILRENQSPGFWLSLAYPSRWYWSSISSIWSFTNGTTSLIRALLPIIYCAWTSINWSDLAYLFTLRTVGLSKRPCLKCQ